ncbi:hypothetical protein [Candidatus Binatus sp.]|uniref:hypothetical protein n=1 Tax=Candidatus Binatus sp. TaxID=2811406 RepID=UPI00272CFDB8|nr:hypothetical protein [Candidatus Binatus sp.]
MSSKYRGIEAFNFAAFCRACIRLSAESRCEADASPRRAAADNSSPIATIEIIDAAASHIRKLYDPTDFARSVTCGLLRISLRSFKYAVGALKNLLLRKFLSEDVSARRKTIKTTLETQEKC